MKKQATKDKVEELRQANAVKTMYYTRYFIVRYVVAFYFFINLYWTLMLYLTESYLPMVLPLSLGLFGAATVWEQFRMFTINQKTAQVSKAFFKVSFISNSILLALTVLSAHQAFYPFLNESLQARLTLIGFLVIGLVVSTLMLHKMSIIDNQKDRQYKRISRYLMSLKS